MNVAKVLGTVVASEKHPDFEGLKLLVVQPLDETGEAAGKSFIAVDRVQAGKGDTVLVMREGGGIRMMFRRAPKFAVRSCIVGVVDQVDVMAQEVSGGAGKKAGSRAPGPKRAASKGGKVRSSGAGK